MRENIYLLKLCILREHSNVKHKVIYQLCFQGWIEVAAQSMALHQEQIRWTSFMSLRLALEKSSTSDAALAFRSDFTTINPTCDASNPLNYLFLPYWGLNMENHSLGVVTPTLKCKTCHHVLPVSMTTCFRGGCEGVCSLVCRCLLLMKREAKPLQTRSVWPRLGCVVEVSCEHVDLRF